MDALGFIKSGGTFAKDPQAHFRLGAHTQTPAVKSSPCPNYARTMWRGSADDPNLFFRLALLYMDSHEYDAAIVCFREMTRIAEKLGDDCPESGPWSAKRSPSTCPTKKPFKAPFRIDARVKIADQSVKAMEELDKRQRQESDRPF
jgi:hypothetical protein